jgi:hypothetical protein
MVPRHDYDARRNQLTVRMPTSLYDMFNLQIMDSIRKQLTDISNGSDQAAAFARKVTSKLSSRLFFPLEYNNPGRESKLEPDNSFQHRDAEYPGVIVEVSYSTKRKALPFLADTYILDSNALVKVVIGFDIEYGGENSRKASLSTWRCRVDTIGDQTHWCVTATVSDEVCRIRLFGGL